MYVLHLLIAACLDSATLSGSGNLKASESNPTAPTEVPVDIGINGKELSTTNVELK